MLRGGLHARSLPYLDAVLKEALRLYPPAPTIIRQATRPMDLGGHRVEPGQWLAVAAYSMHRNPAYWQARPRSDLHGSLWLFPLEPACARAPYG